MDQCPASQFITQKQKEQRAKREELIRQASNIDALWLLEAWIKNESSLYKEQT